MIDQGVMYVIYFLTFGFVMMFVGMFVLFEDSSREGYYDDLHDFFKPIYLLFLGLRLLIVLLYELIVWLIVFFYRLIRWPITYYLEDRKKQIEARRRALEAQFQEQARRQEQAQRQVEEAQRHEEAMRREAVKRAKEAQLEEEKRLIDEIRRLIHENQGQAD